MTTRFESEAVHVWCRMTGFGRLVPVSLKLGALDVSNPAVLYVAMKVARRHTPITAMEKMMLTWMRKRKLSKLRVRLAGVQGQLAEAARIERLTSLVLPIVRGNLAKEQAELICQIDQLRDRLSGAAA